MKIEIPELEVLSEKIDRLHEVIANQSDWLPLDAFCEKYQIPKRTFHKYQNEGLVVSKKIGKHVFVSMSRSINKR